MRLLGGVGEAPQVRVSASAPLELMWILHNFGASHPLKGGMTSLETLRQQFQSELRSFQGDGVRGATEAVVLAHRSGAIFDVALDGFVATLEPTAAAGGDLPALLCETSAERRAIQERLRRLQADPELRTRYRQLLVWVWEAVRPEWESSGRRAAADAALEWARMLEEGAGYRTLLDRPHVWPGRPELDELAESALADGRLVLSPGWFFAMIHVVDVDGTLYLARGGRTDDPDAIRRETSTRVAGNLKALSDPTRLGILLWLAKHPASVTEIANHFELSQPTVSGHVQLLRDAGLLEDNLPGRRPRLTGRARALKGRN